MDQNCYFNDFLCFSANIGVKYYPNPTLRPHLESFHQGDSLRPKYESGIENLFLASHIIFKTLSLVREPKKLLLGKNYPMLLPISESTGLAPKTWEKLTLLQNDTP